MKKKSHERSAAAQTKQNHYFVAGTMGSHRPGRTVGGGACQLVYLKIANATK
jgi:hypothetical protein